ncbi:MAG: alpha-L-rhamnosidase [Armatimonadaceae bacterium]
MRVSSLQCEHFNEEPLGIGTARPRLSWKLESEKRGAYQTAYRVRAAKDAETLQSDNPTEGELLWDSGKVQSGESTLISYEGPEAGSGERIYWTVTVWNEADQPTEADAASWWETGLLNPADWQAEWIGSALSGGPQTTVPCPFLRCTFAPQKPVAQARLYATALGLYVCYLNGKRVGSDHFTPGWTDYHKRVQYQTYDVTALLNDGENVWGAILGDGWYCGHVEWRGRQRYGDRPRLFAQLVVTYTDGTSETIITDGEWRYAFGPILEADLLMGEAHDARREMPGWNTSDFNASAWEPVEVFPKENFASIELTAMPGPTVKATQELKPTVQPGDIKERPLILDFGQNLVGKLRVTVRGEAGTTVRFRFAEVLKGGPARGTGGIYTDNLRSAKQTDYYTLKGDPSGETFDTLFTFHGFRYVEITAVGKFPEIEEAVAVVLHSDVRPTGEFECSEPLINQLQRNIDWGLRGNYLEIPTDCPQRDERLGWTGDAQVFVRTAAFNRQVAGFFHKWLQDLRDAQGEKGEFPSVAPNTAVVPGDGGPAWADAGVICPWTIYLCYGDTKVLSDNYAAMQRFIAYLEETSRDQIRCYLGYPGFSGFGDWLALDGSGQTPGGTPRDLLGTAFFGYSVQLMAKIAAILDKPQDAAHYEDLFQKIRTAFQKRFVTQEGLIYPGTQTAYVLALYFNLLTDEQRQPAAEMLVHEIRKRDYRLATGFTSSHYLPHVLTETGHLDVAYALLRQTRWPSWLYAVTQGATTIWERWDGWTEDKGFQDAGMNSFNHYAYGAIGAWMYQTVAGIDVDTEQPGYRHIVMRPRIGGGLTYAGARLLSPYGWIESRWELHPVGELEWRVTVPVNTRATVFVPCGANATVSEGGLPAEGSEGVSYLKRTDDANVYALQSGAYRFLVTGGVSS